jgi:hypothetical protein
MFFCCGSMGNAVGQPEGIVADRRWCAQVYVDMVFLCALPSAEMRMRVVIAIGFVWEGGG